MRLDFSGERVLAVVAHPDDAELLCAGTLARARRDGAAIGICVLCQGEKGQPASRIEQLGEVRRQEMAAAAELLGAELHWGGFPDGELYDGPDGRAALLIVYRIFRPTLILAHSVEDYHPDHRAAGVLAEAASWFAASPGHRPFEPPLPIQPALWWLDVVNLAGPAPHFFIDVEEFVNLKHRMLRCHASQLRRSVDTAFQPLEELMERQYRMRGAQSGVRAAEAFRHHAAWKRTRSW
ncbi:MAG: PIG-L deacetylase family protein [Pirellulaceae bacterium]